MSINPIKLEIIRNALVAVAEEMSVAIYRTSRSSAVREMLDFSTAVFDNEGKVVGQSSRIPIHLNTMAPCLELILAEHIKIAELEPGDVIIVNDPYCGAQHLPDITTFRPIFAGGLLLGFTGAMVHHTDVGGGAPGSYNAAATEIFAEGIRIPPLRIVKKGVWNQELLKFLLQNVRDQETLKGDLLSQIASLEIGERSLLRMAEKYGAGFLNEATGELIRQSEIAMRNAIAAAPDGTYEFEDVVDDDGLTDRSYPIKVKVTIDGDSVTVDFTGSAQQANGSINCTLNIAKSCVYYAVIAGIAGDIPANSGCYKPITLIAPYGSIVNAAYPAAVVNRIIAGHRLVNAIMGALSKAFPDRIPAAYYGSSFALLLENVNRHGEKRVYLEGDIGGWGAEPRGDGASALSCGLHNLNTVPLEMIENQFGVTFMRYALRPDSGGAGKYRGGLGTIRDIRIDRPGAKISSSGDRFVHGPYGLRGGKPGKTAKLTILRDDGTSIPLKSKSVNIVLQAGDRLVLETSGGGGYGNPAERSRSAILEDVQRGYVGREQAKADYGLGVDA